MVKIIIFSREYFKKLRIIFNLIEKEGKNLILLVLINIVKLR